jgi:hypothetical protein
MSPLLRHAVDVELRRFWCIVVRAGHWQPERAQRGLDRGLVAISDDWRSA